MKDQPKPIPRHRTVWMSAHVWWWERESWKHEYCARLHAVDIHQLSLSMTAARAFDEIKRKQHV